MKFSANGFYIESYQKCPNCGKLMYADVEEDRALQVEDRDQIYCSQRCVDWAQDREERRRGAAD